MLAQVVVGKWEMVVAKETTISAQGWGVGRGQHQVAATVDERAFLYGIAPPQDEHKILAVAG